MLLTEFSWSKEEGAEEGRYQGDETLNCHIGITSDGQFEIKNNADSSQSAMFASPEELGDAIAQALRERSSR